MAAARPEYVVLRRRGVLHGRFLPARRETTPERLQLERWSTDRPIFLPGILSPGLPASRGELRRTLRLFEALRANRVSFQDEVRRRLGGAREFLPSGAVADAGDAR